MDKYFGLHPADGDYGGVYAPPEVSWENVLPKRGRASDWNAIEFFRKEKFPGPVGDFVANNLVNRLFSPRLKALLEQSKSPLDTIQWLPAFITDFDGIRREFFILHFLEPADVLSESESRYDRDADVLIKPVLSPEKVRGHKLFNLPGLEVTTVVHEDIKRQVESAGITSVEFSPMPCR